MITIPVTNKIPELEIAINAAINAGEAILDIYDGNFRTITKTDDSPVTDADLKSNEIIKKILSKMDYSILSEEDVDDPKRLSENTIWVIDPLDGTSGLY